MLPAVPTTQVHLWGLTLSEVTNTAQLAAVLQTTAHYGE